MLPASISSARAPRTGTRRSGGEVGRELGRGPRRAVAAVRARTAPVEARQVAGVEPHAARPVVRAGDDVQRPQHPLGHVGRRGDIDMPVPVSAVTRPWPADRGEEVGEVVAAEPGRAPRSWPRSNGATAPARRVDAVGVGGEVGVVGAVASSSSRTRWPRSTWSVPGRIARWRVARRAVSVRRGSTHPQLAGRRGQLAQADHRVGHAVGVAVRHDRVRCRRAASSAAALVVEGRAAAAIEPPMSSATSGLRRLSIVSGGVAAGVTERRRRRSALRRPGRRTTVASPGRCRRRRARSSTHGRARRAARSSSSVVPRASRRRRRCGRSRRCGWWCNAGSARPFGQV